MEELKHECGVAMIRLLKPLEYYKEKYGMQNYALNKLYLLMEKQHNRGQEGAGLATVRLDAAPGEEYMFRERAAGTAAITEIFNAVHRRQSEAGQAQGGREGGAEQPFVGELNMGHLRYSTTGKSGMEFIHPFLRRNNWRAKNLALCGNFNLTNVDEVFRDITSKGQHPRIYSDTYIMLEQVGHRLDREVERLYAEFEQQGLTGCQLTEAIENHVDLCNVLRSSAPLWDGGYVICGLTGSGEMMAMRDPWGIRPAFWYQDDEVVVLASERPVIQTTFDLEVEDVRELEPGQALLVSKNGQIRLEQILPPAEKVSKCSFERIYFSRGSDRDIYLERKELGYQLRDRILRAINGEVEDTVFSFIPNTAEVAFYGMMDSFKDYQNHRKLEMISQMDHVPTVEEMMQFMETRLRSEKVAIKDIKLRTFITEDSSRNDLAAHVYDITYGCLRPYRDNLVIIDDSIVRGTTLKESIIRILDRLHPKKIVLVSSSPQVRYPDYYGIDMARMSEFIAFRAAIALLRDRGMAHVVYETYAQCKKMLEARNGAKVNPQDSVPFSAKSSPSQSTPSPTLTNCVKAIYEPFTDEEISAKMVEMLRPEGVTTPIDIVFQTLDGLHTAIPNHTGDWYFSGDYPTQGGLRLLCQAFINYVEQVFNRQLNLNI